MAPHRSSRTKPCSRARFSPPSMPLPLPLPLLPLLLLLFSSFPSTSANYASWLSDTFSWSSGGSGGGSNGGGGRGGVPVAVNAVSCSGKLGLTWYRVVCGDGTASTYCTLGESVSIEASVVLAEDLSSSAAYVTIDACIGMCDTLMNAKLVDLCNGGSFRPADGQSCAAAGAYDLTLSNFRLPSCGNDCSDGWDDGGYAAGAVYYLFVTVDGAVDGRVASCDVELVTPPDEAWGSSYRSVAIAALLGATTVAIAACLKSERRRIVCACSGVHDVDDGDIVKYEGPMNESSQRSADPPSARFEIMP